MLFAIICTDKPNALAIRKANREAHLAYAEQSNILFGGPLLAEDNETMIGSLLVLEAENAAEAKAWAAQDPYAQAGLFDSVTIQPWRKVFG